MTRVTASTKVRRSREGSVAIFVAVSLVVILGMAALGVDVSHLYKVRTELQNVADSAALAAAQKLDGTTDGIADAISAAKSYAAGGGTDSANRAYGAGVAVEDSDVSFGWYSAANDTFTPNATPTASPGDINAVRVQPRRDSTSGSPVWHPFASFLGHQSTDVSAFAVAAGGGPAAECSFPMVIADCSAGLDPTNCNFCFKFTNNNNDTAGWSSLEANGMVGAPNIASLIEDGCSNLLGAGSAGRVCGGGCTAPPNDSSIQVNNGNFLNSGPNNPCASVAAVLNRTGTPSYFTVDVPIIEGPSGAACGATQFSGSRQIVGFATVDVIGIGCGNGKNATRIISTDHPRYTELAALGCEAPPSGDFILGIADCSAISDSPGGGGLSGKSTTRMRLVQ